MKFNTHKKKLINRFLLWPPTHRDDSIEFWRKKKLNPFFRNVRTETKEGVNARALQKKKKILSACAAFMKFFCRVPTWSKFTLFSIQTRVTRATRTGATLVFSNKSCSNRYMFPPFILFYFLGPKKDELVIVSRCKKRPMGWKVAAGFFFHWKGKIGRRRTATGSTRSFSLLQQWPRHKKTEKAEGGAGAQRKWWNLSFSWKSDESSVSRK